MPNHSLYQFQQRPGCQWTTHAVPGFRGFLRAPDVLWLNDQFYLYYSLSTWGSPVSKNGVDWVSCQYRGGTSFEIAPGAVTVSA
jgi:hypothetical protein